MRINLTVSLLALACSFAAAQINTNTNFNVISPQPIDTRDTLTTLADTANVPSVQLFPGLLSYVVSLKQYWTYNGAYWEPLSKGFDLFVYAIANNADYSLPLDTLKKYNRVVLFTGSVTTSTRVTLPNLSGTTGLSGKKIEIRYSTGPSGIFSVGSASNIFRYNCSGYDIDEGPLTGDTLAFSLKDKIEYLIYGTSYLRHCPAIDVPDASPADTSTFLVYAPAHSLEDSITAYGYVPVKIDYTKANASAFDSTHFAYAVSAPHADTLELKLSGALAVTGHGLTVGRLYYLQDDGTESTTSGTIRAPTVYVLDANTVVLTEVGADQDQVISRQAVPSPVFTFWGGDPQNPSDNIMQIVVDSVFAPAGLAKPSTIFFMSYSSQSKNPTYQDDSPTDSPLNPSHSWFYDGNVVTRMNHLLTSVDLQATSAGLFTLDTVMLVDGIPTDSTVANWLDTNYVQNNLRLPNGAILYWKGDGTAQSPRYKWIIIDDITNTGEAYDFKRILKNLSSDPVDTTVIATRYYADSLFAAAEVIIDSLRNIVVYFDLPGPLLLPHCELSTTVYATALILDDSIRASHNITSLVTSEIAGNPATSIVITEYDGFAYVKIEGTVTLSEAGFYLPSSSVTYKGISVGKLLVAELQPCYSELIDSLDNVVLYANMPSYVPVPPCEDDVAMVITGLIIDKTISIGDNISGDITFSGAPLTIVYVQEENGYAYFEAVGSVDPDIYGPEIEYAGITLSGLLNVVASNPDTVTVYLQDSIIVTRVCGAEISRDTISPGDSLPSDNVTGTGTTNRTALWTAANTIGNSYLLQSTNAITLDAGKVFQFSGHTTAGRPTAVAGYLGYNTTVTGFEGSDGVGWFYFPRTSLAGGLFTPGSVPFAGADGSLSEDNANFFFDNAADRLGIGAAPTGGRLELYSATGGAGSGLKINMQAAGAYGAIDFHTTSGLLGQLLATGPSFSAGGFGNSQLVLAAGLAGSKVHIAAYSSTGEILFTTGGSGTGNERMRILSSGRIGVGVTAPTARFHLPGGTATAGTSSLKIIEGVNTTTPEDGAINHVADRLNFTSGSTVNILAHLSDITDDQTASEVNITDAGGFYTGTTAEAALQEVGGNPGANLAEDDVPRWDGSAFQPSGITSDDYEVSISRSTAPHSIRFFQRYNIPNATPSSSSGITSVMAWNSSNVASFRVESTGVASGSTDGSGDLVVTIPTMPDATYAILATPNASIFHNVVITSWNTTSFTARFFDATGAAIASTAVSLNWQVKDY